VICADTLGRLALSNARQIKFYPHARIETKCCRTKEIKTAADSFIQMRFYLEIIASSSRCSVRFVSLFACRSASSLALELFILIVVSSLFSSLAVTSLLTMTYFLS
jgi:hypothetical protein